MSQRASITVQVQPNASRNELLGFENGVLKVRVAAPPVKGKANAELIGFLAKLLGTGRGGLTIERGHTSRRKVISVEGMDRDQIMKRLGAESKA